MLDLYKILRMVEDEIAAMKKRQQSVLSGFQKQTREDIVRKFEEADHSLLQVAEQKINEMNELKFDMPFLVTSPRKMSCLSVRRVKDESGLHIEIEPIVYPTPYNLKFVLQQPCIGLYSPSNEKGIFSVNTHTPIHGTDIIQPMEITELDRYIDLWLTHKADERFLKKLRTIQRKFMNLGNSEELLMESMLAMSAPMPPRRLIYMCEDHYKEPTHNHERNVLPSAVKGLLRHHLKLY